MMRLAQRLIRPGESPSDQPVRKRLGTFASAVGIGTNILLSLTKVIIGTLTGSPLLAGRGPCLHVRMQSVGTATARFDNQFSSSGINQTRHRIILDVDVHVSILLPGLTTYTKVSNEISVAETVIVGGVPETYTYFSTTPDEIENYADEYIINNG